MGAMASQITSLTIVYWIVYSWKPRVVDLCAGNSPGTGEFPAQMASNAENVSISWRHHSLLAQYRDSHCPDDGPGASEPSWGLMDRKIAQ